MSPRKRKKKSRLRKFLRRIGLLSKTEKRPRQVHDHEADPHPLFDTNWYLSEHPEAARYRSPYDHYRQYGHRRGVNPNPFFHGRWYLDQNPDIPVGTNPLVHYVNVGAAEHRAPSPYFDSRWYAEHYVDRISAGMLPLAHYVREGSLQGLAPRVELLDESTGLASAWYQERISTLYVRMITPAPEPAPFERGGFWAPELRNRSGKPLAVYTAIFSDYDTLKLPHPKWAATADFYCITDRNFRETGAWQIVRPDYHNAETTRIARFYKIHPHLYFSGYEASLWVDGNILLQADPADLLGDMPPGTDMTVFRHPERTRWEEEVMTCCERGKDDTAILLAQAMRYEEAGYQQKLPLIETNVILRRHNQPQVIALMRKWWAELERGSRRDQVSLTYCMDQLSDLSLGFFPEASARSSKRMRVLRHGAE